MVCIAMCCRLQVVLYLLNHTEFTGTITTGAIWVLAFTCEEGHSRSQTNCVCCLLPSFIFHILAALKIFSTFQTKTTVFKKLQKFCSSVINTSSVITQMSLLKAYLQLTCTVKSPGEKRCRWFGVMSHMSNQNAHLSNTMVETACNYSPSAPCSEVSKRHPILLLNHVLFAIEDKDFY